MSPYSSSEDPVAFLENALAAETARAAMAIRSYEDMRHSWYEKQTEYLAEKARADAATAQVEEWRRKFCQVVDSKAVVAAEAERLQALLVDLANLNPILSIHTKIIAALAPAPPGGEPEAQA